MQIQQSHLPAARVAQRQFPLWLSAGLTAFICVLIPVYWHHYGPANFLWFSDIALFGAAIALWTASRLLASMMLLAAALPDMIWNVDFLIGLASGWHPFSMTAYMFDPALPAYLRALSLFHVFLPPLLVWMVWRLGYDRRAFAAQTLLSWSVLLATFVVTAPARNINWVFGPGSQPQEVIAPWLYLLAVLVFFPVVLYLPIHLMSGRLFGAAR